MTIFLFGLGFLVRILCHRGKYIYIFGKAARNTRLKLMKKIHIHHFFFLHTGSPFSILTGFFKTTGGDGEGLEGGGGEGEDGG